MNLGLSRATQSRRLSEGEYIITGITSSYGAGKSDVWLVIDHDLGTVHYTQTPKTWTIDVPHNFNKVEVGVYGSGKDEVNQYGGWAAYMKLNGDYAWKFMRRDENLGGIIHDYIKGREVQESTGRGKWLDVTSMAKSGKNTISYYHYTAGDGIGVKVRIHTTK